MNDMPKRLLCIPYFLKLEGPKTEQKRNLNVESALTIVLGPDLLNSVPHTYFEDRAKQHNFLKNYFLHMKDGPGSCLLVFYPPSPLWWGE